jgi:uncharacterized repeat protein (TIGR02543 family)
MKTYLTILLSAFCVFSLKAAGETGTFSWVSTTEISGARGEYTILDDKTVRLDKVYSYASRTDGFNDKIYLPPYCPTGAGSLPISEIGENAFSEFSTLKEITFPGDSVPYYQIKKIGARAFANTKITKFDILPSVEEIGAGAFEGCNNLTQFVADDASAFTTGDASGPLLLTSDQKTLVAVAFGAITEGTISLPYVEKIGDSAFYKCQALTSIDIPTSVTEIGDSAFAYTGLTTLTIPSNVEKIGANAFFHCMSLTQIKLAEGLKEIGDAAFSTVSYVTQISIPSTVTTIGQNAFERTASTTIILKGQPSTGFTAYENSFPAYNKNHSNKIYIPAGDKSAWLASGYIKTEQGRYYWGKNEKRSSVQFIENIPDPPTTYCVKATTVGEGVVGGIGRYEPGAEVTLKITPNEEYTFSGWTDARDASTIIPTETYTFTMPEGDVNVTAHLIWTIHANAYITARNLISRADAKQALLDENEICTLDDFKASAPGAPLVKVETTDSGAKKVTVKINVKKATDLQGEWTDAGSKEISIPMKNTSNASYYKVIKKQ